jgi:hypothetical protein
LWSWRRGRFGGGTAAAGAAAGRVVAKLPSIVYI